MTDLQAIPWQLLIISLPSRHATPRMRAWRALKAVGAAALRDGAYLLPFSVAGEQVLSSQAEAIRRAGGAAHLLRFTFDDATQDREMRTLFDRSTEYGQLLKALHALRPGSATLARNLKQLRRDYDALAAIDYFPTPHKPRPVRF